MAAPEMEQGGTALDRARAELDHETVHRLWRLDDATLLRQAAVAQQLINRLHGIHLALVAEAESRETCTGDGWSVANRLVEQHPQALRTAKATVLLATDLAQHEQVGAALRAGAMSVNQAKGFITGLKELPDDLPTEQAGEVEAALVEHAKTFDPAALRRISNRMIEVICPDNLDDRLRTALDREAAQAERDRYLSWGLHRAGQRRAPRPAAAGRRGCADRGDLRARQSRQGGPGQGRPRHGPAVAGAAAG